MTPLRHLLWMLLLLLVEPVPLAALGATDAELNVGLTSDRAWLEPLSTFPMGPEGIKRTDRLHLLDLVFTVEWRGGDVGSSSLRVLGIPEPFLLRNRTDLVPILDSLTARPDLEVHALLIEMASMLLPHIDSAEAVLLQFDLPNRRKTSLSWIEWPPPAPDDAGSPPIWISHFSDPPVLARIEGHLASLTDDYGSALPLDYLAASNSRKALALLREAFQEHPGNEAMYVEHILHSSLPLAGRPWQFLIKEIIPKVRAGWPRMSRKDWSILMWYKFSNRLGHKPIEQFALHQLVGPGEAYVQETLEDPALYEIIAGRGGGSLNGKLSNADFANAYRGGAYRAFLDVCRAFGTCAQVKLLEKRLGEMEGWLSDRTVARTWLHGGVMGPGPFPEVVEDYRRIRRATISSMLSRHSQFGVGGACEE